MSQRSGARLVTMSWIREWAKRSTLHSLQSQSMASRIHPIQRGTAAQAIYFGNLIPAVFPSISNCINRFVDFVWASCRTLIAMKWSNKRAGTSEKASDCTTLAAKYLQNVSAIQAFLYRVPTAINATAGIQPLFAKYLQVLNGLVSNPVVGLNENFTY